jgi:hypothetical protein
LTTYVFPSAGSFQTALQNDGEEPATWLERQADLKAKGINGNGAGMPLTMAVKIDNWRTPSAGDAIPGPPATQNQVMLANQARTWTTPRASDGAKGGPNQSFGAGGIPLASQTAHWDGSLSIRPDQETATPGPQSSPSAPTSLRLNPAFVEWLMGWPPGWTIPMPGSLSRDPTDSGSPETAWCHWLRRQRTALSALSWNYAPAPEAGPEPMQLELI